MYVDLGHALWRAGCVEQCSPVQSGCSLSASLLLHSSAAASAEQNLFYENNQRCC